MDEVWRIIYMRNHFSYHSILKLNSRFVNLINWNVIDHSSARHLSAFESTSKLFDFSFPFKRRVEKRRKRKIRAVACCCC